METIMTIITSAFVGSVLGYVCAFKVYKDKISEKHSEWWDRYKELKESGKHTREALIKANKRFKDMQKDSSTLVAELRLESGIDLYGKEFLAYPLPQYQHLLDAELKSLIESGETPDVTYKKVDGAYWNNIQEI